MFPAHIASKCWVTIGWERNFFAYAICKCCIDNEGQLTASLTCARIASSNADILLARTTVEEAPYRWPGKVGGGIPCSG
jgi:hypothetical protein